jgi:hypothetical protein
MTVSLKILIEAENGEPPPTEDEAVQLLQNSRATVANMNPDELIAKWREALRQHSISREHHRHERRVRR